jgi:hypothetical protein
VVSLTAVERSKIGVGGGIDPDSDMEATSVSRSEAMDDVVEVEMNRGDRTDIRGGGGCVGILGERALDPVWDPIEGRL